MLNLLQNKFLDYIYNNNQDILQYLPYENEDALERLYIYRNNINQNLINSLQATYPIILKQIGNNLFVQISKEYIAKHRPTSGDLDDYGDYLSNFLKDHQLLNKYPYLSDLADLEWLKNDVFDFKDQTYVDISDFQKISPDEYAALKFIFNNSVHLIKSKYPLYNIYNDSDVSMTNEIDYILLSRQDFGVQIEKLNKADWYFLEALIQEKNIEEAYEIAIKNDINYDLVRFLQEILLKKIIHRIEIL